MFGLGLPEIAVMLVIVLIIFGPTKLPQLGKSIGGAVKNFKEALSLSGEENKKESLH